MSDVKNVGAGKPKIGGAISVAPLGSKVPTDTVGELDVAFKNLGYVGEDGTSNERKSDNESTKAWGGDVVLVSNTGSEDTFKFNLIEGLNIEVLKTVFGEKNVIGTLEAGITVKANNIPQTPKAWVIDLVVGEAAKRIVIPNGTIIEVGEMKYNDKDPIGYPVTVSATPDAEGNTHYEYIKKAGA